jgi:hypothetical protein
VFFEVHTKRFVSTGRLSHALRFLPWLDVRHFGGYPLLNAGWCLRDW